MKDQKYHTIDPLILQTLNLNERRMNHILNILHGRPTNPPQQKQQLQKNKANRKLFQSSLRSNLKQNYHLPSKKIKQERLPEITKRNQTLELRRQSKDKQYQTLDQAKTRRVKSIQKSMILDNSIVAVNQEDSNIKNYKDFNRLLRKGKSQRKAIINQPMTPISFLNFSKAQETKTEANQQKQQKLPRNSLSAVRNKFSLNKPMSLRNLSPQKSEIEKGIVERQIILQNSLLPSPSLNHRSFFKNFGNKSKQMINDYMGSNTLKNSKSMQVLNPKDIYRLQIENIIAELTPIQKLEEAQKRMKRIKRRNQHLKTFDKKYYSKLNQHDLVIL